MIPATLCGLLLALCAPVSSDKGASEYNIKPSIDSSIENANRIFNAVHSAGRQWGSSYYHNGFSFFPAVMPKGTMLYHGDFNNTVPEVPEWLAFEIEHAEGFAFSHKGGLRRPGKPPSGRNPPGGEKPDGPNELPPDRNDGQKPLTEEEPHRELRFRRLPGPGDGDDDENVNVRGYLHTYQAARDLNLLYIDGMSAGKTIMGTLDSQDLLLRENTTRTGSPMFDERNRAKDLCDLVMGWGFDGVVRTEAGFEVIYCDFNLGLNFIGATRTVMPDDKLGENGMGSFMWTRAIGERYNGLASDRLRLDFSSMVSALFFPINISSSDASRPDLVRLESASLEELKGIKNYLSKVVKQPRKFTVNWQGVVDLIVSRFAKRMASMALETLKPTYFIDEVETITATWFDAAPLPNDITLAARDDINRTADAIDRCRKHYLRPATIERESWSHEDFLIFTSIDTVMANVCEGIFYAKERLVEASESSSLSMEEAIKVGKTAIQQLMDDLGWTIWKQAQPCPPDEVLAIAMWPFGKVEDHWNPGCRSVEQLSRREGNSYWRMKFGPRDGQ